MPQRRERRDSRHFFEEPQESGKHRRSLPLGVVKQHNSATIDFDPSDDELKLLSR
jgi:hypothetical protein